MFILLKPLNYFREFNLGSLASPRNKQALFLPKLLHQNSIKGRTRSYTQKLHAVPFITHMLKQS